jgi:DNA-binding MarR family transcriptional regulator
MVIAKRKQSNLENLARELNSLTNEIKQDTFFSLINTTYVVHKFLTVKSKIAMSNVTKYRVLDALVIHSGSLTPTALSKMVYRSKCAITRAVNRLEKDGLVKMEKQPSLGDRRFKKVFITQKGIEFMQDSMLERRKIAKDAMAFLSPDDMYALGKMLRRLRKNLLNQISKEASDIEPD